jgi:hypothetical protein
MRDIAWKGVSWSVGYIVPWVFKTMKCWRFWLARNVWQCRGGKICLQNLIRQRIWKWLCLKTTCDRSETIIATHIKACHLTRSWVKSINAPSSQHTYLRSILMLSIPAARSLIDFGILTVLGDLYKLWFSLLCSIVSVSVWVVLAYKATHAPRPFSGLLWVPLCFIPPVVPYHWQSTVSYITKCHHGPFVA